jgi:hypothetical protein
VILDWAVYFDRVYEAFEVLSDVPKPPKRMYCDPEVFSRWIKWAKQWDRDKWQKGGKIVPFGTVYESEEEYYRAYAYGG